MTSDTTPAGRPAFTSVSIYNHPSGLLSFWYASEWQLYAAPTSLPAITLTPDPTDPETHVAITVRDVRAPLAAKERPDILAGVREGLASLDGCVVESLTELREGRRWGIEWHCTFLVDGQRCRRRARLYFSDRYQYAIVLQGSSEERYAVLARNVRVDDAHRRHGAVFPSRDGKRRKRPPKSRKQEVPKPLHELSIVPFRQGSEFPGSLRRNLDVQANSH